MSDTKSELQDIFRNVFADDELNLTDSTSADDIEGWDSMMMINLMIAIEKKFKIRFAAAEIANLKGEGQNIGTMVALIEKKTNRR